MKRSNQFFSALLSAGLLFSCAEKKSAPEELPVYVTPDFTPHWMNEEKNIPSHQLLTFSMTNQDGQNITLDDVKGKIHVVNFFFTTCNSICPKMMNQLKRMRDSFPESKGPQILSFTVLPETDSVGRLHQYAEQRKIKGADWWLLTGKRDSIYQLARQSYFADEDLGYNATEDFLHTENAVLIDVKGRIRGVYNATLELEINKMIQHIRILQKEMN